MSNNFKIGDIVEVLDENFKGTIIKVEKNEALILTPDGFELPFEINQLILIGDEDVIKQASNNHAIEKAKTQKVIVKHHKVNIDKKSKKEEVVVEIDLHIEKLVKNFKRLSSYDILNTQVDTARYHLEQGIKNRIPKLVFIHGTGEGVLKTELEYLFGRYSEISFQDANYRKYGMGATEVYVKQNSK